MLHDRHGTSTARRPGLHIPTPRSGVVRSYNSFRPDALPNHDHAIFTPKTRGQDALCLTLAQGVGLFKALTTAPSGGGSAGSNPAGGTLAEPAMTSQNAARDSQEVVRGGVVLSGLSGRWRHDRPPVPNAYRSSTRPAAMVGRSRRRVYLGGAPEPVDGRGLDLAVPERGLDATQDLSPAIEALGVDLQEDLHGAPGPLRHLAGERHRLA